jgi:hypothetical protein
MPTPTASRSRPGRWAWQSRDDLRQLFRLYPELVVTIKPEVAVAILTGLGQWDESSKEG